MQLGRQSPLGAQCSLREGEHGDAARECQPALAAQREKQRQGAGQRGVLDPVRQPLAAMQQRQAGQPGKACHHQFPSALSPLRQCPFHASLY